MIFESINRDIKIHLLTKHEGDLQATLERHRIAGIFDEIVHIPRNDEKWKYIFESRAVFIDDSFAEREAGTQINLSDRSLMCTPSRRSWRVDAR